MEKYLNLLREAKGKGETIKILEFYKKCQKDGISPPKIMREVIKTGLQNVLEK
ncbi:hypothetical protein [Cetobacterium sp.]|uniref:hypothetical protein n=1 Tax=Cetobacterium sp. TaxID=2071632 RepID=UPI003F40F700